MTIMLGIDPGELNGIVILRYGIETAPVVDTAEELRGGAIEVGDYVRGLIIGGTHLGRRYVIDRVLMETWIKRSAREQRGDARSACEPLGVVKWLCAQYGVPFMTRNPGPPSSVPDDLLDAAGYWQPGGEGHMRAILKHMLQQLVDEGHVPTIRRLGVGHAAIENGTWIPEPTRKGALTKRRNKA